MVQAGGVQVMTFEKIRQLETAVNNGQLTEAHDLLEDRQIFRNRYGRGILGHLSRNLLRRGNEYLQAGRL